MGILEEEEAQDKYGEEDGDEGTTTSGEDINRPDKDAEQDNDVSDGDKNFDRDAVQGSGSSEADKWDSGKSYVYNDEELLEVEEM